MVAILAVVGTSGSGKTTVIEYLVSRLTGEGMRVGTIKHVHHPGFTFDVKGKDTWRHARAGAKVVAVVAPEEIAIIKRREAPPREDLEWVLDLVRGEGLDLVILEGFHSLISRRRDVPKIVTARDERDLRRTIEGTAEPILAVMGPVAQEETTSLGITVPVIDLGKEGDRIFALVKEALQG